MSASAAAFSAPREDRGVAIREADARDNEGLLALTRTTPMKGVISLRIDRDPDFFALLALRGEARVLVAEHASRIVGSISAARRTALLLGQPQPVTYIGDLKVHPSFAGSGLVFRLIRTMQEYLLGRGDDVLFTVVAEGNRAAQSLLEGRGGMPRWRQMGRFLVDEMLPRPHRPGGCGYDVGPASAGDAEELAALHDRFHAAYQLAPWGRDPGFASSLTSSGQATLSQVLAARLKGRIVASLWTFDAREVKSNVVIAMPPAVRAGVAILRGLSRVAPFFHAPELGEPLRLVYLRAPAHEPGHERALVGLVRRARYEAFKSGHSFAAIGLHERDPLRPWLRSIPRFTFTSLGFCMSLRNRSLDAVVQGIPVEDYALV